MIFIDDFLNNQTTIDYIIDISFILGVLLTGYFLVRSDIRLFHIFKVFLIIYIIYVLLSFTDAVLVSNYLGIFVKYMPLLYVVILAPEIRNFMHSVGKSITFKSPEKFSESEVVDELLSALKDLSSRKVGAIITIERSKKLDEYIRKAVPINGDITQQLLSSIFITSTPLHDGAVILRGNKIACAAAFYPSSSSTEVPKTCGSRHRAAVGVSEISDALTIIVSEETGKISVAIVGKLEYGITIDALKNYLVKYMDSRK